jgi:alpha-glucoside transport system substrate-binding protein
MHRQASFIPAFFPEGTEVGEDADFFYFPAYAGKDLGARCSAPARSGRSPTTAPAAHDLIASCRRRIAHEVWMGQEGKGFLTPHKASTRMTFPIRPLRKMNEILLKATTFRFDGSDLMPGGVGAGAFWTGMVDYAGGEAGRGGRRCDPDNPGTR